MSRKFAQGSKQILAGIKKDPKLLLPLGLSINAICGSISRLINVHSIFDGKNIYFI